MELVYILLFFVVSFMVIREIVERSEEIMGEDSVEAPCCAECANIGICADLGVSPSCDTGCEHYIPVSVFAFEIRSINIRSELKDEN